MRHKELRYQGEQKEALEDYALIVVEKPRVFFLSIGIGNTSVPALDGALEDSQRLASAMIAVPACRVIEWRFQEEEKSFEKFLQVKLKATKTGLPSLLILHFSCHVLVQRTSGELWLAKPSCPTSELDSDDGQLSSAVSSLCSARLGLPTSPPMDLRSSSSSTAVAPVPARSRLQASRSRICQPSGPCAAAGGKGA